MYQVRRLNIGKTDQLDALARECGRLYSQTLVSFWRTVRHKGIWLKPKHLMRWYPSDKLHAHTADACVQAFFASLKSWRKRKKAGESYAKPPRKRKWYFRIEYKRSAMALKDGMLRLSNGRGNEPLVLEWPWELPVTVVIHWTGTQYEAIATYEQQRAYGPFPVGKVAGIDLGEVVRREVALVIVLYDKGVITEPAVPPAVSLDGEAVRQRTVRSPSTMTLSRKADSETVRRRWFLLASERIGG